MSLYFLQTEKTIEWILPYQQYQNQLVDQAALMLTLSGRVSETQQVLANQTTFRLRTPDLTIKVSFRFFFIFGISVFRFTSWYIIHVGKGLVHPS